MARSSREHSIGELREKLSRRPGQSLCYVQAGVPAVLGAPVSPCDFLTGFAQAQAPRRGRCTAAPGVLRPAILSLSWVALRDPA